MNRKKMNAVTAGIMAFAMMIPCTNVFAASDAEYTKNENVYAKLASDGKVEGTYVVNKFTVTDAGEITDIGDYSKVQNLTNTDQIKSDKEEHTMQAEEGKFYYQGDIDRAELPWKIEVSYFLDGDEMDVDEVAGKEGDLEIHMDVTKNPALGNKDFFNTYMLQISATLDETLCEDIVADGANIADAGSNARITYTVTPGTKETNLSIRTSVKDFEMDDITITGAPTSPDFHESFVEAENNEHMDSTIFAMSVRGVEIPEEEVQKVVTEDERNILEKFVDKVKLLF